MTHESSREGGLVRETETEEMARYGITRVPADSFYYREFHYTNLKDAIAQAIRDKAQLASHQD